MMSSENKPTFPCVALPQDLHECKLLGLYPQRQEGLWMQRVVITGGELSAGQWRALADLARRHTPGTPLHLTTRQDVELHNLAAAQVPAVQQELAQAGLSTVGGGGDTLRNVTVCPRWCQLLTTGQSSMPQADTPKQTATTLGGGTQITVPDLMPLARRISDLLHVYPGLYSLPRKFKISLSACSAACGRPWINDVGLIAIRKEGRWGFQVIAAGSLGPRPATGMLCFDYLPAAHVLPLVLAAVRVFDAHGDREHRSAARLRHVRQRMGDAAFLELLKGEFDKAVSEQPWPAVQLQASAASPAEHWLALTFPNGDAWPEAADALADLADRDGIAVRIATNHKVIVAAADEEELRQAVAQHGALARAAEAQPCVVACPGNRWCKRGLVDTNRMADAIRQGLPSSYRGTVAISGCPNGCAHSAVADIGLIGQLKTNAAGQRDEAFHVMHGGGMGRDSRLGQSAGIFPADEVIPIVKNLAVS